MKTKPGKKLGIIILVIVLLGGAASLIAYKVYRVRVANQKVILLAFDDYNADTWREYFDLFDEYDAKVTFFVTITEPTDFCYEAIERGHEIGYHTRSHIDLKAASYEEFYEEAIAPIEIFREKGIELTSFAYPGGNYEEWMNEELLQYYNTVRGAWYYDVKSKADIQHCFIEAYPLDNIYFESDEVFREKIVKILDRFCEEGPGAVTAMYSHAIADGGAWCIAPARLKILLEEAQKRDIRFCTFKEWQKPF
ncbi:MAG: polysaccharide deacetylase family protein [Firmicutes bacterium]|nr:polysaccharide deacetylase family protein [Bacillota bacterium]